MKIEMQSRGTKGYDISKAVERLVRRIYVSPSTIPVRRAQKPEGRIPYQTSTFDRTAMQLKHPEICRESENLGWVRSWMWLHSLLHASSQLLSQISGYPSPSLPSLSGVIHADVL